MFSAKLQANQVSKITTIDDVNNALDILVANDPALAKARNFVKSENIEIPLRLRPAGFGGLAELVISQLVSKAAAAAIHQRFIDKISPLTPQAYLDAGENIWREIGLSRPKQTAIHAVANAIIDNSLKLDELSYMPVKQATDHLCKIKGIGPWSAQVYLLFCEGHADIFPAGDLALREAARQILKMDERPDEKMLAKHAEIWSPHRGTAARLLWAYYAATKNQSESAP